MHFQSQFGLLLQIQWLKDNHHRRKMTSIVWKQKGLFGYNSFRAIFERPDNVTSKQVCNSLFLLLL